jgi:hypothetical protein
MPIKLRFSIHPSMNLNFTLLRDNYSIYRLKTDSGIPDQIYDSEFYSITRTNEELSVVCKHADIIPGDNIKIDKYWRILRINGPLDLSLVGILADVSGLLKENKIPIFVISTFDTDYVLVKNKNINKTLTVLINNGYKILIEEKP